MLQVKRMDLEVDALVRLGLIMIPSVMDFTVPITPDRALKLLENNMTLLRSITRQLGTILCFSPISNRV